MSITFNLSDLISVLFRVEGLGVESGEPDGGKQEEKEEDDDDGEQGSEEQEDSTQD